MRRIKKEKYVTFNDEEEPFRPDKLSTISLFSCFLILMNCFVGVGIINNSRHARCGILFMVVANMIVAALIYYTTWMLLYVAKLRKTSYFETTWMESGYKLYFVISAFICVPCLGYTANDFNHLNRVWKELLIMLYSSVEEKAGWLVTPFLVDAIFIMFLYYPVLMKQDLTALLGFSIVKAVLVSLFVLLSIYWCFDAVIKKGNTIKNDLKLFDFGSDYLTMFSEYIGTYVSFPFFFLSISSMHNLTYKRGKILLLSSFGTFTAFNIALGTLQFVAVRFFPTDDPFIYYLPNNWSKIAGMIVFMLSMIATIPGLIEPMRMSTVFMIEVADRYPRVIWGTIAIVWALLAAFLSTLTGNYIDIFLKIVTTLSMLMQFLIPPILLISVMNTLNKFHWIGIVFNMVLGFGFSFFLLVSIKDIK